VRVFKRRRTAEAGLGSAVGEEPTALDARPYAFQLRPSIRSRVLRDRIEQIEALPLDPYLQAVVSFAFAAAAEALATFHANVYGEDDGDSGVSLELLSSIGGSSEGFDRALGAVGWAYAARAIEVTWNDCYEEMLAAATAVLSPRSEPERRILDHGRVGGPRLEAEGHDAFQRTVLASMHAAVIDRTPSDRELRTALGAWLIAWADGWAAFGRLAGQYSPDVASHRAVLG